MGIFPPSVLGLYLAVFGPSFSSRSLVVLRLGLRAYPPGFLCPRSFLHLSPSFFLALSPGSSRPLVPCSLYFIGSFSLLLLGFLVFGFCLSSSVSCALWLMVLGSTAPLGFAFTRPPRSLLSFLAELSSAADSLVRFLPCWSERRPLFSSGATPLFLLVQILVLLCAGCCASRPVRSQISQAAVFLYCFLYSRPAAGFSPFGGSVFPPQALPPFLGVRRCVARRQERPHSRAAASLFFWSPTIFPWFAPSYAPRPFGRYRCLFVSLCPFWLPLPDRIPGLLSPCWGLSPLVPTCVFISRAISPLRGCLGALRFHVPGVRLLFGARHASVG